MDDARWVKRPSKISGISVSNWFPKDESGRNYHAANDYLSAR